MPESCPTAILKLVSVRQAISGPNSHTADQPDIADVSHFVDSANPMDAEAASRGTTVYLVDKRIDMLPALLGTNLCSLRPFVERLAFSVIWVSPIPNELVWYCVQSADLQELTPDGEIVGERFVKSVIASKEAFTYEAAQVRKDDL